MSELRALVPWPRLPATHEVDRLRRQCEALIQRNAELEAQAKPENPKVIQSHQKMLVGVTNKHPYRFDPQAARNTAPANIKKAVEDAGYTIDEGTVLKHLRAAYEEFPPEPKSD